MEPLAEPVYTQDESWNDDSVVEDYGKPINGRDQSVAIDSELEAQLDGNGSELGFKSSFYCECTVLYLDYDGD